MCVCASVCVHCCVTARVQLGPDTRMLGGGTAEGNREQMVCVRLRPSLGCSSQGTLVGGIEAQARAVCSCSSWAQRARAPPVPSHCAGTARTQPIPKDACRTARAGRNTTLTGKTEAAPRSPPTCRVLHAHGQHKAEAEVAARVEGGRQQARRGGADHATSVLGGQRHVLHHRGMRATVLQANAEQRGAARKRGRLHSARRQDVRGRVGGACCGAAGAC